MNVVLTGSSTGIGRAIAQRLLARGDHVWGIARSDQSDLATQYPGQFHFSQVDVAQWADLERAAANVASVWPHLDAIITAAGIQGEIGRALSADPIRWSATVRANLDGTFFALRAFATLIAGAPRRAKVVCFSGGGATKPRARFSAYGVAKTGVVRLVETIAEEEGAERIDINTIAPGAINTRLTDEVLALGPTVVGDAEYTAAQKVKASAPPPETAPKADASLERAIALVEWLLSPASDGISGRLLAAPWDPWPTLDQHVHQLARSDIYTLRRIVPEDRGLKW